MRASATTQPCIRSFGSRARLLCVLVLIRLPNKRQAILCRCRHTLSVLPHNAIVSFAALTYYVCPIFLIIFVRLPQAMVTHMEVHRAVLNIHLRTTHRLMEPARACPSNAFISCLSSTHIFSYYSCCVRQCMSFEKSRSAKC